MSTVADPLTDEALEALRTLTGDPQRRVPAPGSWRRSATWSSIAPGCCASSAPAGGSRPCTSSRRRCCAAPAPGPTLIVSPLLALMRNQLAAARRLGLRAHTINSTNREEWDGVA